MPDAIATQRARRAFRKLGVAFLAALFVFSLSDVHSPAWAVDEADLAAAAVSPCAQSSAQEPEIGPGCNTLTPDHPPALLQRSGGAWMLVRTGAPLALPQAVNWLRAIPATLPGSVCAAGPSPARAPPA